MHFSQTSVLLHISSVPVDLPDLRSSGTLTQLLSLHVPDVCVPVHMDSVTSHSEMRMKSKVVVHLVKEREGHQLSTVHDLRQAETR